MVSKVMRAILTLIGFVLGMTTYMSLTQKFPQISLKSELYVFIISIVKTISISTNIVYVDSTNIPIKKLELLVIGIEKLLISITIIYLFYYLIIGNL